MKKTTTTILFATIIYTACNHPHQYTREELKDKLKQTMTDYLYQQANNDSSHLKYHILDISYYPGNDGYACQFKVNMIEGQHDTTGEMIAKISPDFKTVVRRY